jgi:sugar transferase (PEP-CTERM/EpsH1 system associated)
VFVRRSALCGSIHIEAEWPRGKILMSIRILHVVEAIGIGGGIENGIANLIERMDSTRFEHILCGVFRLGPQVERYPADRVQIVCLEQKPRRLAIQAGSLAEMIRKLRPDVVHSRNWGALEAVVAARWVGQTSVIHSEHGVEMDPAAEPRRRSWLRRVVFSLTDHVFCVSYQLRDMLAARTGFPEGKIGVIHNGVKTSLFRADASVRKRFRAEFGIGDDGCVGRLNRIKDYPTIFRAAELFNKSCTSWRLLIVGSGAELSSLQGLVNSSPILRDRVHFMGASNCIPEILNALDVYVLPSLCEGISNSLLEAMATSLPVIASDTGGNPEVVVNGMSGLLFPVGDVQRLADQLLHVYSAKERRVQLGEMALCRVKEQFSLESMINQYEEMYSRLVRTRVSRAGVQNVVATGKLST